MKNLDQKRAQQALVDINHVGENQRKDYGSLAKSLPMMLQTNGLAQTMAFMQSKASSSQSHRVLVSHMSNWLNRAIRQNDDAGDFLIWIVNQHTNIYRQAANEAVEFSIWLRRFAEAKGWDE